LFLITKTYAFVTSYYHPNFVFIYSLKEETKKTDKPPLPPQGLEKYPVNSGKLKRKKEERE
jgi:hypothetical protein